MPNLKEESSIKSCITENGVFFMFDPFLPQLAVPHADRCSSEVTCLLLHAFIHCPL